MSDVIFTSRPHNLLPATLPSSRNTLNSYAPLVPCIDILYMY